MNEYIFYCLKQYPKKQIIFSQGVCWSFALPDEPNGVLVLLHAGFYDRNECTDTTVLGIGYLFVEGVEALVEAVRLPFMILADHEGSIDLFAQSVHN